MSTPKVRIILFWFVTLALSHSISGKQVIRVDNGDCRVRLSREISGEGPVVFFLPEEKRLYGKGKVLLSSGDTLLFRVEDLNSAEVVLGGYRLRKYTLDEVFSGGGGLELQLRYNDGMASQRVLRGFVPLVEEVLGMPIGDEVEVIDGSYVIILPDVSSYETLVRTLARWKQQLGFHVRIFTLGEVGNSADEIRAFLQDAYYSWEYPPEYLLLIGDVDGTAAMPAFYFSSENDVSDHPYACLVGDDYFPDLFVGRFSVDSFMQLALVVQKVIGYEKEPYMEDPGWFLRGFSIGGNYNNIGSYPITPVWVARWVRSFLLSYGYSTVDTLFYPPIVEAGEAITDVINQGVGIVNYRGWADANGWHFPEYHVEDLEALQNGWRLPFVTSIVCNTGDFANSVDPCFGEAWLRAGTLQNPAGAIAFIGPSDLHTSTKFNNAICTGIYQGLFGEEIQQAGPAMVRGKLELFNGFPLNRENGDWVEFYFHVYNLLGDPSLRIWKNIPKLFDDTLPAELYKGQTFLEVEVNKEGIPVSDALVTITSGDELLGKAISNADGRVLLAFPPITDEVTVTISRAGYKPLSRTYTPEVPVAVQAQDFLLESEYSFPLRKGQTAQLRFYLVNSGTTPVQNLAVEFSATSGGLNFNPSNLMVTEIPAGDSVLVEPVEIIVNELQPFTTSVKILLNDGLLGGYSVPVISSYIVLENLEINGEIGHTIPGNSDFTLGVLLKNLGLNDTGTLIGTLSTVNERIAIIDSVVEYDNLAGRDNGEGATEPESFFRLRSENLAPGSQIPFRIRIQDQYGMEQVIGFTLVQGPLSREAVTGPDKYGYFIYDNFDNYNGTPLSCQWLETEDLPYNMNYQLRDDDLIRIPLPFTFRFYGEDFDSLTICSNGWISFADYQFQWFRNWPVESALAPPGAIFAFWDDLKPPVGEEVMTIKTGWNDTVMVVTWSDCLNRYDYDSGNPYPEIFQIQLRRNPVPSTPTGDDVVDIVYSEIYDVDAVNNYSTIGLKGLQKDVYINYIYSGLPYGGASVLDSVRFLRISTLKPENLLVDIKETRMIEGFSITRPYPNPFNSSVVMELRGVMSEVQWHVYNIKGIAVDNGILSLEDGREFRWEWRGINQQGTELPSGVYLVVFQSGEGKIFTRKVILLR